VAILLSIRLLSDARALSRETMLDLEEVVRAPGSGVGARLAREVCSATESGGQLMTDGRFELT